jgi:glycosyltransferase involved in cell wall biosynthesis
VAALNEAENGASLGQPRVVIVGEGPPIPGGISTYVTKLTSDPWLRGRVRLAFMNTAPSGAKLPGAFNLANIGLAFRHAWGVLRRGRRADVVHLNVAATPVLPLLRALFLAAAARLAGAAVILHAHTGQLESCLRQPIYRSLIRLLPGVVDAFVVVSETARVALPPLRGRVRRLDNGVDPAEFATGPKETDPPVLAFVGTVCERKGLIDLLDALRRIERAHGGSLPLRVLIVGDGRQEGPGAFERVRSAYSASGLDNVVFEGVLDRRHVVDVLARSSIFCLPSHREGFPLSILEAMAAGVAVVATRVGDIPRVLDHGGAGLLVEPHDVDRLGAAIELLLREPEERRRLGAAARERAEREFGYGRMRQSLYQLYVGLSDRRDRARSTGDRRRR